MSGDRRLPLAVAAAAVPMAAASAALVREPALDAIATPIAGLAFVAVALAVAERRFAWFFAALPLLLLSTLAGAAAGLAGVAPHHGTPSPADGAAGVLLLAVDGAGALVAMVAGVVVAAAPIVAAPIVGVAQRSLDAGDDVAHHVASLRLVGVALLLALLARGFLGAAAIAIVLAVAAWRGRELAPTAAWVAGAAAVLGLAIAAAAEAAVISSLDG